MTKKKLRIMDVDFNKICKMEEELIKRRYLNLKNRILSKEYNPIWFEGTVSSIRGLVNLKIEANISISKHRNLLKKYADEYARSNYDLRFADIYSFPVLVTAGEQTFLIPCTAKTSDQLNNVSFFYPSEFLLNELTPSESGFLELSKVWLPTVQSRRFDDFFEEHPDLAFAFTLVVEKFIDLGLTTDYSAALSKHYLSRYTLYVQEKSA